MPYADKAKQAEYQRRWQENNRDKLRAYCRRHYKNNREKRLALDRKRIRDPAKLRANGLRKRYGLSPADWEALFNSQGRVCAVCFSNKSGGRGWSTDHCHTTGRVRGILCVNCNIGIGNLRDNPLILRSAISYLERHNK